MIRTTLTPQDTNLQLSLDIPEDYVGKKIEVLIFAADEPKEHSILKKKLLDTEAHSIFLMNNTAI